MVIMKRRPSLILTAAFALCAIASCKHRPTESPQSAKEAIEQFYKLETQGRWLGPEHWNELRDYLHYVGTWREPYSILVIKSCQVGDLWKDSAYVDIVNYRVEVDCLVWGQIDAAFHFAAMPAPGGKTSASGQPIMQRMFYILSLSNAFERSDGTIEKGNLRWRMVLFSYQPVVTVDAALSWATQMRNKSNDPLIRYNAGKTITVLKSLSSGTFPPLTPAGKPAESASQVVAQFIPLESRLTPDKWDQLAQFFVETPKPTLDHLEIVDIVGTAASADGDTAYAELYTNSLGVLDSSMRLSNYPFARQPLDGSSASACFGDYRIDFNLFLSDEHWETASDGTVKELNGPLAWRVEYFSPLLNLDTAIHYVTQTRDTATNPTVKRNAAETLRILNYYKQGKRLPDKLYAQSSGGCG
jgi:hypothetical protein